MKTIAILLFFTLTSIGFASQLRVESVTQPLYLHGSDTDPQITLQAVPYVTFHSDPEWRFAAISAPCVPGSIGRWTPHDINLASLYQITATAVEREDSPDLLVTIDAAKAVRPDDYPFTIEQVIDSVVTCVRIMYPQRVPGEGALEISVIKSEGDGDSN